jgi:DNA-binding transcriptional MerR regulator
MATGKALTIGALAKATGTAIDTIRYYERIGLLRAPPRTGANYRSYGLEHLYRLSFVRRSRDLGFTINQVRALLDLADQKERECHLVDEIAAEHLGQIERKIADLTALGTELRNLIAQCGRGTIGNCRIIEALSPTQ